MIGSACLRLLLALAILPLGSVPARAQTEPDSGAFDWSRIPEYIIVPGDRLTLDFGPRPDLTSEILHDVTVRPDGRITVFPIGDVVAAGHTPRELEATLVQLLAPEVKQPRVTVEVTQLASNKVHVLGEVLHPGSYPLEAFMTTVQAITAAGGFANDAARNSVIVFNRNGRRSVRVTRVRVGDQLKKGALEGDLPLSRFDIIYVPRSTIGNLHQFAEQFLSSVDIGLGTVFTGWELLHLDRVFVLPVQKQ